MAQTRANVKVTDYEEVKTIAKQGMATQLVHNQMQHSLMSNTQPVQLSKSAMSMRKKDYSAKRVQYMEKDLG